MPKAEGPANTKSMNNDNTTKPHNASSQPDPSSEPFPEGPPQVQLESLLDLAQEHAEDALREDGALFPSLFAASPKGLFLLGGRPLKEALEKKEFATDARLICTAEPITAVVVAVQAWVIKAKAGEPLSPGMRPSKSPQRVERIILMGEALAGCYRHRVLPILRDTSGGYLGLLPAIVSAPEPPEGPLARLLPEAPPTPEVRAFAAAMLKARGVNLVEASK